MTLDKFFFLLVCCFLLATVSIDYSSARCLDEVRTTTPSKNEGDDDQADHHTFVLLGASGDLSKREIYPALWYLYRDQLLPPHLKIIGFARKKLTIDDLRKNVEPFVTVKPEEEQLYDEFWKLNDYVASVKNDTADFDEIDRVASEWEADNVGNRIFYLAVPPSIFLSSATQIKRAAMAKTGWTRVVVEKPFGRDSGSSDELSEHLFQLFTEDQIYRMDHFLGYEMVQNLLPLRFANRLLSSSWNKENIAAVEVDFKENFGVEGRGGYFDEYGIIRDVMQNHLLQIVSLVAMEKPKSSDPNDVRDAKVDLLKQIKPISLKDVVLGQYVANPDSEDPRERIGYLEDPTVPAGSLASTFAMTVLKIDNPRWKGVPFIIRAGKGLNVNRTDVILQYKKVEDGPFAAERNEVIFSVARPLGIRAKLTSKTPGITSDLRDIDVEFDYGTEFDNITIAGGYERLLLDVLHGSQQNFVRTDELHEAWRIFTPILHRIEDERIRPVDYRFGTTGPREADDLESKYGFAR